MASIPPDNGNPTDGRGIRLNRYDRRKARIDPQSVLIRSKIAPDLLEALARADIRDKARTKSKRLTTFSVIVEMNENFPGGAREARGLLFLLFKERSREDVRSRLSELAARTEGQNSRAEFEPELDMAIRGRMFEAKSKMTPTYAFATLDRAAIEALVKLNIVIWDKNGNKSKPIALIHRIWLDHRLRPFVYKSAQTIKADAALSAFDCKGEGIVWAVADTGVDATHPHFKTHRSLHLPSGIRHRDFTILNEDASNLDEAEESAKTDPAGHGSHVAGIIAGETVVKGEAGGGVPENRAVDQITVEVDVRISQMEVAETDTKVKCVRGIAPLTKILSLRVLDAKRRGKASDLLAAIGYIQELNDHGRRIRVHGLNLSVGYPFEPQWFAPGQSALCVEVNRLVKSGVVVVAAAGNGGYGRVTTLAARTEQAAFLCTISDPGNAEHAITVGSTHRDMPHTYGVSYFSGKGPTADGRQKPDIVAPGERIVSCASQRSGEPIFKEDSGTSMAAPHVSGAIAAFLSVRGEFIGQPERVKEIFVTSATDLRRRVEFQGSGALDLMRALQSV